MNDFPELIKEEIKHGKVDFLHVVNNPRYGIKTTELKIFYSNGERRLFVVRDFAYRVEVEEIFINTYQNRAARNAEICRLYNEKFLSQNGYEISRITSFENIINDILNSKCNMVLLDINLPGNNGEYICKEVRKISEVPIVMITSVDSELDQLISLNYGADDYITKPFNIQILLAKIATILKRTNSNNKDQSKIDCKDFILNLSKSTIEKEEKEIELTKNEFKIIYYLVQNRGKIVPREEIMSYLWDSEMFVDDNTLTVNITRIRNKLEEINLKDILETRRGQGYILI